MKTDEEMHKTQLIAINVFNKTRMKMNMINAGGFSNFKEVIFFFFCQKWRRFK